MKSTKEVYCADSITLNVTNACNLNCSYCFEYNKTKEMMSKETAIKAVETFYRKIDGVEPFTINFFGGEPLLNWPVIKAVIDYCNENKYKVRYGMTTNLTLLTDEIIQYIDDNSIPILVSIDGIKGVHDRNRCSSYDKVINNINILLEAGLGIFIEARMTIMPYDAKYAMQGIKELYELGINNFCPMPVYDIEWHEKELQEYKMFISELTDFFISIMNDPSNTRNISIKNIDDLLVNILSPEFDDPLMCPIFKNTWCTVDVKGDIYACHQGPTSIDKEKELLKIGNLDEIDETKIMSTDMKATYSKEECKNCVGKAICKCGCPTENMRTIGSYTTPNKTYCEIQKTLVNIISLKQYEIMNSTNIHNRMLIRIKESMKIKDYIDQMFNNMNLYNKLEVISRVQHISELMDNAKDIILPRFYDYILKRLEQLTIIIAGLTNTQIEIKKV